VLTDNAKAYTSDVFREMVQRRVIKLKLTRQYRPQITGKAGRSITNGFTRAAIAPMLQDSVNSPTRSTTTISANRMAASVRASTTHACNNVRGNDN
jgi:hypothetical protein